MSITTIGGVVSGDASKDDGGTVKASFNVTTTNIKYFIVNFTPGRYIATFIGKGIPIVSTYSGNEITGLPAVIKGEEFQDSTGAIVFDVATTQDGLLIERFDGAVAIKTWSETAVPATVSRPADTWTNASMNNVWNAANYDPTSPYYDNGVLMIGSYDHLDNAIFISEDDGLNFKRIRLPQNHYFPKHGAFLFDSVKGDWWISPRGTNYWYKTSHENLVAGNGDKVAWERIYKMHESNNYEFPTIVIGGQSSSWPDGNSRSYNTGANYDQLYKITDAIWFSNMQNTDILRTGDGGETWQEFRTSATPISPMTVQPSGHFDYGIFSGAELVMGVREGNNNGHVVRITNFLSSGGPTVQSMDIQDTNFYDIAFNGQFTTFTTSRGLYRLQNGTTSLTELTGNDYGASRRYNVGWTGSKWLFFDKNPRNNFYRIHQNDPFFLTAYDPGSPADGRENCQMITFTNVNWNTLRGNASNEITNENVFSIPPGFQSNSIITFTKQGGGNRTVIFPYNTNSTSHTYDIVYPTLITDNEGDSYTLVSAQYGKRTGTLWQYNIGGTNGQFHWAKGANTSSTTDTGGFSFDGGKTWKSSYQFITDKALIEKDEDFKVWWFKADNLAQNGGSNFYGATATDDGIIVIHAWMNGRSFVMESRDDGDTWTFWRSLDGATANGGLAKYDKDVNPLMQEFIITNNGTYYGRNNNEFYRWTERDLSDLVDLRNQTDFPDEANERIVDISTVWGGGWVYDEDSNRVITIGVSSEKQVIFDDSDLTKVPQINMAPLYEGSNSGMATGNGMILVIGAQESSSADYRAYDEGSASYDGGDTWFPIPMGMRTRSNNHRSEANGSFVFAGGHFIYPGYGFANIFRSRDGSYWDAVQAPFNTKRDYSLYNNDPEWDERDQWRDSDNGFLAAHGDLLYYFSRDGAYYTSPLNNEITG